MSLVKKIGLIQYYFGMSVKEARAYIKGCENIEAVCKGIEDFMLNNSRVSFNEDYGALVQ